MPGENTATGRRDVPEEKPEGSDRLSLAKAYAGLSGGRMGEWSSGHVFLRTGFERREDILFAAQCGDTNGWHGHADPSGFYLQAYGEVLAMDPGTEGEYGSSLCEWMKGPDAHNVVLVDGEAAPPYTVGDDQNWPDRFYHGGTVEGFVHTETLDLVAMDFAEGLALNPKLGEVKRAKRYVLFFRRPERRGFFVLVDDVDKDGAPHRYEWILHPDRKHTAEEKGPGRFAFSGGVTLDIRMVEPRDPVFRTASFEGYGVKYLRLSSRERRDRGLFLTVLYPRTNGMPASDIAELREGGAVGVRVGEDVVVYNPGRPGPFGGAEVRADGTLAALRISQGTVRDAVLIGGESLTFRGSSVRFAKPASR